MAFISMVKWQKEDFNDYINSVNKEIDSLLVTKNNLEDSFKKQGHMLAFTELKKNLEQFLSFQELLPKMLHTLIGYIEIKADGSLRIF